METTQPKPGPHLHPAVPVTSSFRDLAKAHARASMRLLGEVDDILNDDGNATSDELLELIGASQAHALASIACAQIAPVARVRRGCTQAGAK